MCKSVVSSAQEWASKQFLGCALGDARLNRRVVEIAARTLENPSGWIPPIFPDPSDQRAVYRFLANGRVTPPALLRSHAHHTAFHASNHNVVVVAIDASSFSVKDPSRQKGTGLVGDYCRGGRGFLMMNAIAIAPDGAVLGMLGQKYWTRTAPVTTSRNKRKFEDKETRHWEDVTQQVESVLETEAPNTRAWFQKDRGADAGELICRDLAAGRLSTVRVAYDRVLDERNRKLFEYMKRVKVRGTYSIEVAASATQQARLAQMEVRFAHVTVKWKARGRTTTRFAIDVVWARETRQSAQRNKPIDWMLYSTWSVNTVEDAFIVLQNYQLRWRVEEFHRANKSGRSHAEDSQLRTSTSLLNWFTLLGIVSTRILELRDKSRSRPNESASLWFSPEEIQAILLLRKPKSRPPRNQITLEQAVRWIAELGGYTGKSSGGPPGMVVIGRGLDKIQTASELLRTIGWKPK